MLSIRSRTAENRAAAFEKGSVALICFERGSEALQKSGVAPRHAKTAWIKHYTMAATTTDSPYGGACMFYKQPLFESNS